MSEQSSDWAPLIKPCGYDEGLGTLFRFWCEGCKSNHMINTDGPLRPQWTFNWSVTAPTFSPSYFITTPGRVCHSYIRDGNIEYLGDCHHDLRSSIVKLKVLDYPQDLWDMCLSNRGKPLEELIWLDT